MCPSCGYAIAGQHPDLMRIELTEYDSDTEQFEPVELISIARVRALIDFAQITSHRRRAKVAVIAPAERMLESAANALLKTLEEPPAGTHLILVSDQPDRLLPTILSRCRRLAAPTPSEQDGCAWLKTQGVIEPAAALAQAGGAPLLAFEYAEPSLQRERKLWLSALADPERLSVVTLAARVDAGGRDERRARLGRVLDWLVGWSVDLARVGAGGAARRNGDFASALAQLASHTKRIPLFRFYRSLLDQQALIAHPLQPRSVAEAMLIEYQALFA
jgi:DNA polymerase-3 subunit delta'